MWRQCSFVFVLLCLSSCSELFAQQFVSPPELIAEIQKSQALLSQEKAAEAESIMAAAAEKYSENPAAWYLLGYSRQMQKKYDEALTAYEKANNLAKNRAMRSLYNMACIYAIRNDKEKAFSHLDLAVNAGFANFEHVQRDEDLANLRGDPRFEKYKPSWLPNSDQFSIQAGKVETVLDDIDAGTGGLNIDEKGRLYTADFGWNLGGRGKGGNKIYRVTPDGRSELFCESLKGASGNTFDKEGNLFQSNIQGNFISKITRDGKATTFCSKGLRAPVGLAFNSKGELFACSCGGNSIEKVDSSGKASSFCSSLLLKCPNGIAIGPDDTIYVCNFSNGDVLEIDKKGNASILATIPGNNNGHLIYFRGVLFVIARANARVFQVGLDGKVGVFAGTGTRGKKDGDALESTFSLPNSLIISPDEKWLYVNETSPTTGDQRILGPTRIRRIELLFDK